MPDIPGFSGVDALVRLLILPGCVSLTSSLPVFIPLSHDTKVTSHPIPQTFECCYDIAAVGDIHAYYYDIRHALKVSAFLVGST